MWVSNVCSKLQNSQKSELTFRSLGFFNTNMQAYFKGILFHYYKEFPYICIYFWKGNILENLNLLNKKISEVM